MLGKTDFHVCEILCPVFVHKGSENAQGVGINSIVQGVEIYR